MGELEVLAKAERNRYQREWRAKNQERVRESNKRYWEKRAQRRLAGMQTDKAGV